MFGEKLKALRTEHGYTMEVLADLYNKKFNAKMTKGTISRYEKGLQEPMVSVVAKFAELFGVSIDYLASDSILSSNKQIETLKAQLGDQMFALYDGAKELTEDQLQSVIQYMEFVKMKKRE